MSVSKAPPALAPEMAAPALAPEMAADPYCRWETCDLAPGDVIVLRLDTLHLTACNTVDTLRFSCDTRWLPSRLRASLKARTGLDTVVAH